MRAAFIGQERVFFSKVEDGDGGCTESDTALSSVVKFG
jgi:hypothetical protein